MKLYLVRHGIAQERLGGAVLNDSQRPLTDEGRHETRQVAQALKKLGVRADIVVSSPLTRARQTAEIFNEVLGEKDEVKIADALAPGGSSSGVYKFLQKLNAAEEVFCVGHEPDIGKLAASLMWAGPELDIPFKKAGVLRVDVPDVPPTIPGTLKWFITPKIASHLVK
ncbi:MAG TPA: phosphohistidine phosphatase SixA [Planktothrix sp.]|jgi:phosphohistidine phosphatase